MFTEVGGFHCSERVVFEEKYLTEVMCFLELLLHSRSAHTTRSATNGLCTALTYCIRFGDRWRYVPLSVSVKDMHNVPGKNVRMSVFVVSTIYISCSGSTLNVVACSDW